VVAVVVALWVVDGQAHKGVVARNVDLVGHSIGGMDRQALDATVASLADRYTAADVEIKAPDGGFHAGAGELGVSVRRDATVAAALQIDHRGFVATRIWRWASGFVSSRKAPVVLDVDENAVRRLVAERDPLRQPPVEPNVELKDGHIVAVDGKPGRGIDPANVVRDLRTEAGQRFPLVASVPRKEVPPRFTVADAQRVAAEAEALAVNELPVVIEGVGATVPAATVRTWLRAVPADDGLRLGIDTEGAAEALATIFPEAGEPAVDAGLEVVGGKPVITPAHAGSTCCAPEAATAIEDALRHRRPGDPPVNLPLKTVPPARDEEAVGKLGIVEVVGGFTTNHAAGEPRVTNIHRMADIVRGSIIEPGGTFSLNGTVGPRTLEKGFVEAPVIDAEYKFSKDVGGGVSQFSTTLFNAAFFAGLDIPTYGMHGIYISRYPYGREATLDYPSLDLKVYNSTPYGVLIWPSYGASSITVTLYSTHTVEGAQTNQTTDEIETTQPRPTVPTTVAPDADPSAPSTEAPPVTDPPEPQRYVCTRVTTERTRTYTDGHTSVDKFYALYAPQEGVVCPR
jgi:vancomycin resistance protein YoaR